MQYDPQFHYRQVMLRYLPETIQRGNSSEFIAAVCATFRQPIDISDFNHFSTELLVDYIRRTHKFYISTKLPEIAQSIYALSSIAGVHEPAVLALSSFFLTYISKLKAHIEEEETLLLPYIDLLVHAVKNSSAKNAQSFFDINYSVIAFEAGHTETETDLNKIKSVLYQYKPPAASASLHRILVSQLSNFVEDLRVHAFIEDEVLVPRVRQMELQVFKQSTIRSSA